MRIWSDIQRALEILQKNGVVGLPTETVYGLAGRFDSALAIERIFTLKERPSFDPLICHIGSLNQISSLALNWSPTEALLANRFWPGPLTIVTQKHPTVSDRISSGLPTVGIRMPQHPVARRIIREAGAPLAAPSANKFGRTSPTTAAHVREAFGDEVFVVDGGEADVGIESTVISVLETSSRITIQILRPGLITESDFRNVLDDKRIKEVVIHSTSSPASPGTTETHYQPKIPLVIVSRTPSQDLATSIEKQFNLKPLSRYSELSLHSDARIAARDLYSKMHEISRSGASWMFFRRTNERQGELWQSIWNRLEKAASLKVD